ncbi:MAG: hypothetical protein BWY31_00471 [Lentisphaerae bacterium ADurb.Bin242]|nr:MAG: hypothetical protein BWY31_00471 [Lentisphaerae bacterium ADurb.Bin242]
MQLFSEIWKMIVESNVLNLVYALLLFLAGWLVSMWIASRLAALMKHWGIGQKISKYVPGDKPEFGLRIETVISRVVFFILLLLTILGCMSVLNLTEAVQPIRTLMDTVFGYVANVIGAILLAIIAWIVASVLSYFAGVAVNTLKIDEKLSPALPEKDGRKPAVSTVTATTIYYVVLLLFIPAILRTLKIAGITDPLERMFEKFLIFIPNIVASVVILVIGLFIAGIIRKAVSGLLFAVKLDELGEKAGCKNVFGEKGLSQLLGIIAYVLVAIPVVISALTALKIDALSNTVSSFFNQILNATGNILGAAILIFAAFIAGGIVSGLVAQLLDALGFNKLIGLILTKWKSDSKVTPAQVVGKLTMIVIMLFAALAACNILGFTSLAELITTFMKFGGNVLIGIVVLLIGIFLSNVAADAVNEGNNAAVLSLIVRVAVLVFTGAIALNTMNIGGDIVKIAFMLVLGTFAVAAAIAFGIGGRDIAARKLEEWNDKFFKK